MEDSGTASRPTASPLESILASARAVLTDPAGFFRTMPRSGGFVDPLIFVVALAIVSSLVAVPFWLLGIGPYAAFPGVIATFLVSPLMTGLFSFVGAAILYAVWRALGSQQSYETAYRCAAYMSAISPFAVPLSVVPYIGGIAMVVWGFFLTVLASEHVHAIDRQKARTVFGVIAVVLALMSISAQRFARSVEYRAGAVTDQLDKLEEMSPEEAGKAVGEFLKGLQGATEEEKKESGE
jgi:hypothetical protein